MKERWKNYKDGLLVVGALVFACLIVVDLIGHLS